MLMTVAEKYTALIKNIGEYLKGFGFKKKGYTFHFKIDENWVLINFQKSRKSSSERVEFTVNVGIASGVLLEFFTDNCSTFPTIENVHLRYRLSHFIDGTDDRWWEVDQSTDLSLLANEQINVINASCIDDIKKLALDQSLIDLWQSGKSPGLTEVQRLLHLTALLFKKGKSEQYSLIKNELLEKVKGKSTAMLVKTHLKNLEGLS